MTTSFHNRTAIISGGLGDIGKSIALALADQGAHICLGDLLPLEQASEFLAVLTNKGVQVHYQQVDVSNHAQINDWVANCVQQIGIPDIVIANAATFHLTPLLSLTQEEWEKDMHTNLSGPFYLCQTIANRLLAVQQTGHMVLIGSWAAHAVHPHIPSYSISKAGLRMLCQCLALELAPYGILVNEIAPGYVEAGLSAKIWEENPSSRSASEQKVPLKRLIQPAEVAAQVVHLCDASNRHITGSTLLMDGGLSLLAP